MRLQFGPIIVIVVLMAFTACGGEGCGKKTPPTAPEKLPPAATRLTPHSKAPSPAPKSLFGAIDELAPRIPIQATQFGIFPASRVQAALESLPAGLPRLVYAMTADDFKTRLRTLYGVDLSDVAGTCAFALLPEAGPLVMCPGGSLSEVKGSYRWVHGKASGYNVTRNGVEISFGIIDGYLTVGTVQAVSRAVLVSLGSWPRLSDGRGRWMPRMVESTGVDAFGHSALFFLDPSTAPWCGDLCTNTAVFASEDAVIAIARAVTGEGPALQARAEAWWQEVGITLGNLQGQPEADRLMRMPDSWLKPADLLARSGTFRLREDHLLFEGRGDPIVMLTALNAQLPQRWLSEMPEAAVNAPAAP